MSCHTMHPIQDLFLEGFLFVLQIDMHFICTPMWTKKISCKKWVLQDACKISANKINPTSNSKAHAHFTEHLACVM
jgi:hypothetical protein